MTRPPSRSTLFPYTTLFRSDLRGRALDLGLHPRLARDVAIADQRVSGGRSADRKSTRLNSSHVKISYAVFCLKKKTDLFDLLHFYLSLFIVSLSFIFLSA